MKYRVMLSFTFILFWISACAPQGGQVVITPVPTLQVAQKPTYKVQNGDVVKTLELRGRVSAMRQQELFFGANGVVDQIWIDRGEIVKAGQVLATLTERVSHEVVLADARLDLIKAQKALDALTEEADLHSAEALVEMLKLQAELEKAKNERLGLEKTRASALMITEAETLFAMAEANLRDAYRMWENVQDKTADDPERAAALSNLSNAQKERERTLINLNWYTGHATEQQIAEADAKIALAEAKYQEAVRKHERIKDGPDPFDVALAEATLSRAQLNLDKAQASLDGLTITAPFDGQVLSVMITPGTQVTAFKAVLTLVDPAGLEITLLPTASELADLSSGQEVQVRLPNQPGQKLNGVIRYIPLTRNSSSSGQEVDQSVRVSIEGSSTDLNMGAVAIVLVQLEKRENVLWISPAALRTFQNRDFVIIQDGEVQRRVDVSLGLRSEDRVEVLDGLNEGQVVLGP